jgi:hypothetical protein
MRLQSRGAFIVGAPRKLLGDIQEIKGFQNLVPADFPLSARSGSWVISLWEEKMAVTEVKVLAQAIYEIRLLLSHHLGSEIDADLSVRIAAHLAYALHNDALAVIEGNGFDVAEAVRRVAKIDSVLGVTAGADFVRSMDA